MKLSLGIIAISKSALAQTTAFDNLLQEEVCDFEISQLHCAADYVSLDVPACAFRKVGLDENQAHNQFFLGNCIGGFYEGDFHSDYGFDGQSFLKFAGTPSGCGFTATTNSTHILYHGQLSGRAGESNGIITRETEYNINLECDFSKESTVSLHNFFTPIISSVEVQMETIDSIFHASLGLFTDLYETPLDTGHTGMNQQWKHSRNLFLVQVPDPVYAEVNLEDVDNLTVQLEKCWATPSSDPDDSISYTLFDSFGYTPTGFNDENTAGLHLNCAGNSAKFWFQSFKFVDQGKFSLQPAHK